MPYISQKGWKNHLRRSGIYHREQQKKTFRSDRDGFNMKDEKKTAALKSVISAVLLTVTKIVVGFLTGSLGILAEAAHSGLDLVAAFMTYIAVKISNKPADKAHRYGHGKIENLSALFETLLLLLTCVWIIYESIERLINGKTGVEITWWSYGVMVLSIVIDVSRSRMLYKAARKFKSQALEADALHFSTDIWSSTVVLLGLVCVQISDIIPGHYLLREADALAALGVALIVIVVSAKLGIRTIQALVDTAPTGMEEQITTVVETVPGVINCHNVRVRHSGPQIFADIHILTDGESSLFEAHLLTEEVEYAIQEIIPEMDITVHPEPYIIRKPQDGK